MQKIRKTLKAVPEKTALPINQPTNQKIITNNTDHIGPRSRGSKKSYMLHSEKVVQIEM